MPCYNCSAEFGLLRKEIGCEKCGFSFCSKCCKREVIPSKSGENMKRTICNKCFKQLTSGEDSASAGSPPLAHKKRMMALKKQSYSIDSASHFRMHSESENELDRELAERLQKLKRDRVKEILPSDDEIEERLAKLKGMDPLKYKAPPIEVFRPTIRKSSADQMSDLIQQVTEEVAIESSESRIDDDIAARLAILKGQTATKKPEDFNIPCSTEDGTCESMDFENTYTTIREESNNLSKLAGEEVKKLNTDTEYKSLLSSLKHTKEEANSDEEDNAEADKLVEQLLTVDLDEHMEDLDSLNDDQASAKLQSSQQPSIEEFPWCSICTENAKIRCFGCDEDLYCLRCFRECHDSLDIKDHRTCPFLPPKNALP